MKLKHQKEKLEERHGELNTIQKTLTELEGKQEELWAGLQTKQGEEERLFQLIGQTKQQIDLLRDRDAVLINLAGKQHNLKRQKTGLEQCRDKWSAAKKQMAEQESGVLQILEKESDLQKRQQEVCTRLENLKTAGEEEVERRHQTEEMERKTRHFAELVAQVEKEEGTVKRNVNERMAFREEAAKRETEHQHHQEEWELVKNAELRLAQLEQEKTRLEARKGRIQELADHAERLDEQKQSLTAKQAAYQAASDNRDCLRDSYHKLEQQFLNAQAGVLASHLEDGSKCPVCGSIHHPSLAVLPEQVPGKEELDKKKEALSKAEARTTQLSADASYMNAQIKTETAIIEQAGRELFEEPGGERILELLKDELLKLENQEQTWLRETKRNQQDKLRKAQLDLILQQEDAHRLDIRMQIQENEQNLAVAKSQLAGTMRQLKQEIRNMGFLEINVQEVIECRDRESDFVPNASALARLMKNVELQLEQIQTSWQAVKKKKAQYEKAQIEEENLKEERKELEEQKKMLQTASDSLSGTKLTLEHQLLSELQEVWKLAKEGEYAELLSAKGFSSEMQTMEVDEETIAVLNEVLSWMCRQLETLDRQQAHTTEEIAQREGFRQNVKQMEDDYAQCLQNKQKLKSTVDILKSKQAEEGQRLADCLFAHDMPWKDDVQNVADMTEKEQKDAAAKAEKFLTAALEQLQQEFLKNKQKLEQREFLKQQIPKQENFARELEGEVKQADLMIERLKTEGSRLEEQTHQLEQLLGGESQDEAEARIFKYQQRKQTLERERDEAEQTYRKYQTDMTMTQSAAETLENQLKEAGEYQESEIEERKQGWLGQREETSHRRTEHYAAHKKNREIYDLVCGKQDTMAAVEQEYIWIKALSDTAGGALSGKQKIELETYIQMTYFDRILRRANLRLLTMSSGQYELKRQEDGTNKKEKAGLELNVIDHYNGTERSVKTLSGGETFLSALSLALGLSDEIQSYAGGIQMDAMFVDEGFGSLDEESLNQAMKALGSLTEGNRIVGIISHVSELKERIEKKIMVTKNRGKDGVGSSVVVEGVLL